MTQSSAKTIALLFAKGDSLMECRLLAASETMPCKGDRIELPVRDTHQRSTERCTRECCAVEPTATYVVRDSSRTGSGWDGLNAAIENRDWAEGRCRHHEWCNLFDSYSLASYLGLVLPFPEMPEEVIIIEVAIIA
ncbi:MAG: hypothetical protein AB7W16_07640 [Candidatus Obscuribacterales bacterium]